MGLTKSQIFSVEQNRIATIAKAIGHPARVAILLHLIKVNKCICGDLVEEIGLAQPTISQHLRELRNVGIIKGNVDGVRVCYCIDHNVFREVRDMFNSIFNHKFDCNSGCC